MSKAFTRISGILSIIGTAAVLSVFSGTAAAADDKERYPETVTSVSAEQTITETTSAVPTEADGASDITTDSEDTEDTEAPGQPEISEEPDTDAPADTPENDQENNSAGWTTDESGRTFFIDENGDKLTGYQVIGDKEYYFAANGVMKNGWRTIDGKRLYFSPETGERVYEWVEYNGNRYYCGENGKVTGFYIIGEKTCFFDSYGILLSGWFEAGGCKYYSDEKSGVYTGRRTIDGTDFLFSSNGRYKSGWQVLDGKRVFYDYDEPALKYGWINYNGYIYYADEKNGKYSGEQSVDGLKYRFSEKGVLQLGFQDFSDGMRYYDSDGKIAIGFYAIENNTYYFSEDGVMLTGWLYTDEGKYYLGNDGIMLTGWQTIDGNKHYFGKDGAMLTGFRSIDGRTYYFDGDGVTLTGWQTIDGKKYYFDEDGVMLTGLQTIGDNTYGFDESGVMQTGFADIGKNKHYFDKDGVMVKNKAIDGYQVGWDGIARKFAPIQLKAQEIIKDIGTDPDDIFDFVFHNNVYRYIEDTKDISALEYLGWSYFAEYALNHRFIVCYYFAALEGVLLEQAGHEARIIYGSQGPGRGDHYWNQVKINGKWVNYDACMGHCAVTDDFLKSKGFIWKYEVYPVFK